MPKLRLYTETPLLEGMNVPLLKEQAHYLVHVMRADIGDPVHLFNGRDGEWQGRIDSVSKKGAFIRLEKQTKRQDDTPDIRLCFAPVKKTATDFIIKKATEMGASSIQPVFTRFTATTRINTDRMRANAIEAAEQSERLSIPEIMEPVSLTELLENWEEGRTLYHLDETGGGRHPKEALSGPDNAPAALLVGPEGGFEKSEVAHIASLDFAKGLSLGPRILKAETAVVAGLCVFQLFKGDWDRRPAFIADDI